MLRNRPNRNSNNKKKTMAGVVLSGIPVWKREDFSLYCQWAPGQLGQTEQKELSPERLDCTIAWIQAKWDTFTTDAGGYGGSVESMKVNFVSWVMNSMPLPSPGREDPISLFYKILESTKPKTN
jgi:hypothetical protein